MKCANLVQEEPHAGLLFVTMRGSQHTSLKQRKPASQCRSGSFFFCGVVFAESLQHSILVLIINTHIPTKGPSSENHHAKGSL